MRHYRSVVLGLIAIVSFGGGGPNSIHAEQDTVISIVNGLGRWDIHFVNVSPASSTNWGDDQLDVDQILRPDEAESWIVDPGQYDLRVRDEDGDVYVRYDVCIPHGMTVQWRVTLDDLRDN